MQRGRGIISSIFGFGGRDPFDDPFFTQPFPNLSQSSMLHPTTSDDLQRVDQSKSPVIQEIDMDDEEEAQLEPEEEDGDANASKKKRDRAYANRNPLVEHPEDQTDGNFCFYSFSFTTVLFLKIRFNKAEYVIKINSSKAPAMRYFTQVYLALGLNPIFESHVSNFTSYGKLPSPHRLH